MPYTAEQLETALRSAESAGDAESAAVIREALESVQGAPRGGSERPSYLTGLAQQAGQGVSFGWLDEAISKLIPAAVETFQPDLPKVPGGEQWMLDQQRQEMAQFQGNNPVASGLAQVGGAMLTGAGAAGVARAAAPGAAGAVSHAVPPWMLSTGVAAGGAGAMGAGAAEEGNRLQAGLMSAGVGAVGGAAAHALFKRLGPSAWGWLKQKLSSAPSTDAQRVMATALRDAGLTAKEADDYVRAIGPDAILADVPDLRGTAVASSALPGAQRDLIQNTLTQRDLRQQHQLWRLVSEHLKVSGKVRPHLNALAKTQKEAARANYEAAYDHTISRTPVLRELMEDPLIVDAVKHAKKLSRGKGISTLALKDGKLKEFPNMEGWDWIQRGLRSRAQRAAAAGKKDIARTYETARRELLGELDAINPDFGKARQTYARHEAVKDAVEYGQKALREDTEILEEILEDYTSSERQGFMLGLGKALREQILNPGEQRDVTRIPLFTSPLVRERLETALGKDATKSLMEEAGRIAVMRQTKNAVMSRSTTGDILSARQAMGVGERSPLMQAILQGASPVETLRQSVRSLADTGPSPETVGVLSRGLFTPGTSAQRFLAPGPMGRVSAPLGGVTGFLGQQSPIGVGAGVGGFLGQSRLLEE